MQTGGMNTNKIQESRRLVLREATPEDAELICEFIRELAVYEKLEHEFQATPKRMREMLFGARHYAEVIIAEWDDSPAGFALYFYNFSTFLAKPGIYLEDLFVRPEFRGHGIGKALLTRLARRAVAQDCGRVEWSVLDWNEPAIGFYKKLGAKMMDEWTVCRLTGEALQTLGRTEIAS